MGGYQRVSRNLFDSVATTTDVTAAGADEALGTRALKYATFSNNAATVGSALTAKNGLKSNNVNAKGSMPLWAQGSDLRIYMAVTIPASIASNTGTPRAGAAVLAQDDNAVAANGRAVFAGLTCDTGGSNRRWVLGLVGNAGFVRTDATVTATSLGTSTGIQRPFRVDLSGTVVTMYTPDGTLTFDYAGDAAALGTWYGLNMHAGSSVTITQTLVVEAVDFAAYSSSFTPANAAWDRTAAMTGIVPLLEFAPAAETYSTAGATPTYDPADSVYGAQSLVQQFNGVVTERWEKSFTTPVDLSAKSLALIAKITAPEQLQYGIGTLAADFIMGTSTSMSLTAGHSILGSGPDLTVDLGGGNFVHATSLSGNTLNGCTVVAGSGTVVSGSTVVQHNQSTTIPVDITVSIATDSAAYTAGNHYDFKPVVGGYKHWATLTWLCGGLDATLGPEARKSGTGCDLASVGYVRITAVGSATIPRTDSGFQGPQDPATTMEIKWDALLAFTKVAHRRIAFTFDDGTTSHYSVVANEIEKPRPGFPNGMRATFPVIVDNIENSGGDASLLKPAELMAMAAKGHEVAVHVRYKAHHESENNGGRGPLQRWDTISPGGALQDAADDIAALATYGVHGPSFTMGWPYSQVAAAAIPGYPALGIKAARSGSLGGVTAIVTNGGTPSADVTGFVRTGITVRFLTWPVGDVYKLPIATYPANLSGTDQRGFRTAIRAILEMCKQGASMVYGGHQMQESGVTTTGAQWNRDMFASVLNYISDLKQGTNVYGDNAALDHYADLDVVPLLELVSGVAASAPAQLATVTIKRSDVFPPGTVVGIYSAGAARSGQPPTDAVIASGTVDSAGILSVLGAGLAAGVGYVAYAQVNGEHRYVRARSSLDGFDRGEAVGTGDTSSGAKTVLNVVASAGSFRVGQVLAGPGIQSGSRIQDISGSTLTLDQAATATASGVALAATGAFSWRAAVRRRRSAIGTA